MDRADSDRQGPLASGPAQTIDRAGSAVAAGGPGLAALSGPGPAASSPVTPAGVRPAEVRPPGVGAAVRVGPGSVRAGDAGPRGGGPGGFGWWRVFRVVRGPVAVQLGVLAGFVAAGIAVSWPRVTYLAGRLPATRDAGSYVWGFWWVARQVEHLGNPWFTRYIDAPAGAQLGLHALMPLPGVVMMPVTVVFGPSASYNLLSVVMPGVAVLCDVPGGAVVAALAGGRDRGGGVFRVVVDADVAVLVSPEPGGGGAVLAAGAGGRGAADAAAGVAAGGGPGGGGRRGAAD